MKSVNKQSDQLSGHLEVLAVPQSNIAGISGSQITLRDPEFVFELICARESIKLQLPSEYSQPGNAYKPVISGFIPGRSSDNDTILDLMLRFRFVVVLRNADGKYTRTGDMNQALKFGYEYSTSPDPAGQHGYTFSFSGAVLTPQKSVKLPFSTE